MRKTVSGTVLALLLLNMLILVFDAQPVKAERSSNALSVPFHFQNTHYYCGPACLQMVFDYYSPLVAQLQIAEVARTDEKMGGTFIDDMIRAGHFSNISTSMGNEMPRNITGYSSRKIGYTTFEQWGMTIADLKTLIDEGYPIILLMWYDAPGYSGHFRVVVGYDETHIILHDPWNNMTMGGTYGGPSIALNYSTFLEKWEIADYWGLVTCPWSITLDYPAGIHREDTFTITANITYPCPDPFPSYAYPASSTNVTIQLPLGLSLVPGENATKPTGDLQAGESVTASWSVKAESFGNMTVVVEAEGKIEGSTWEYVYEDRIGASTNFTIEVLGIIHDTSVAEVSPSRTIVGQGFECNINVTIDNEGECTETLNVTVYANETIISTQTLSNLAPSKNATILFSWNTANQTGFPKGNYMISAYAWPVQGEVDTADNTLVNGWVVVTIPGDVNGDCIVDIFDLVLVASAYGSTPISPNWNPNTDINGDNIVDIFDLVIVASHYGETDQ